MARMIPAVLSHNCSSPGEREIYYRLKHAPGTQEWIVLHSLDLANHSKQIAGELDFVIIVPYLGVLCLEVKAHRRIRRENGLWYYGSSTKGDPRGPFQQAAEGMHSLRSMLTRARPHLARVLFWSAVAFPYIEFDVRSAEWHEWQVIDSRLFRSLPFEQIVKSILLKARDHFASRPSGAWILNVPEQPDLQQCLEIAEFLRPSFEIYESASSRISRIHADLKRFTQEQFAALDAMEDNDRVVFSGPAGTGKTFLALECARRATERGSKVLFICFNRLLSEMLRREAEAFQGRIEVRTIHSYMLSLAGRSFSPDELAAASSEFWQIELPSLATDTIAGMPEHLHTFDELIVDEAQDILREPYLDLLDLSLRGGLGSGRWRMFGDFDKQNIYRSTDLGLRQFVETRGNNAPIYRLRVNCRNTPRIGSHAELLGGLSPGYTGFLRPDDERDPERLYYTSGQHQEELLLDTLDRLLRSGVGAGDIVILSPLANETSAAGRVLQSAWRDRLKPYETYAHSQYIRYTSIHAFKGLEAPVVIVTDIESLSREYQDLLYVAATRALDHLVLLLRDTTRNEFARVLNL